MCICLKDYYDAIERVQHVSSLEYSALDLEEQVFNEEVEHGEAISLSDEELQLDEAMRGNSEEEYWRPNWRPMKNSYLFEDFYYVLKTLYLDEYFVIVLRRPMNIWRLMKIRRPMKM